MTTVRPILPPAGRLVRLGVVLDTRLAPDRLREVARMCDRAGIDALWVGDRFAAEGEAPRLDAWTALTLAGAESSRVRLGVLLDVDLRPAPALARMAVELDRSLGGRLEIGVAG